MQGDKDSRIPISSSQSVRRNKNKAINPYKTRTTEFWDQTEYNQTLVLSHSGKKKEKGKKGKMSAEKKRNK